MGEEDNIRIQNSDAFEHNLAQVPEKIEVIDKKAKIETDDEPWIPDKAKKKYHDQRLSQSKWAFRLSFWGSIAGFIVIVCSTYVGVRDGKPEWAGIISGTIIEVVSALFYTLSNSTNEKITEFFAELTKDSNTKDAIKLAKEIEDKEIKDGLLVKLSLHLSGINEDKICKNTKEVCNKN